MDLISRDEAVKRIQKVRQEPNYQHDYEDWRDGLIIAENIVDELPTIEERKEGKWIRHVRNDLGVLLNDTITCSLCSITYPLEHLIHNTYCPNCGARMEGE